MTTYIDVIRHGEPVGGRRYRGFGVNDPLTDKGWSQMRAAVPSNPKWQHIVSSPLIRCSAFACELADDLNVGCTIEENFKEIGFGDWEGKSPDDILQADPHALTRFYADPVNNRPQGAEPLNEFSDRVWAAYQRVVHTYQDQHVLVVAHAGVARAITANILKMSLADVYSRFRVEYAGIISSTIEHDQPPKMVIHGNTRSG